MPKIPINSIKKSPILDTLAQLPPITCKTQSESLKTMLKRARSKWYTTAIVSRLKYLSNTKLKKYYSHAWNCNNVLTQQGKKLTGKYCNTRVCHICCRIRTAKLMIGYVNQLGALGNLEFVTLTIPNCLGKDLSNVVDEMIKQIVLITRNLREKKKHLISGIRKLEITYNEISDTFHPHFHLLVDKNVGNLIVDQWLERMPEAKRQGWDYKKKCMVDLQVVQVANDKSLKEIFKYTTKIIAKNKENNNTINVYLPALNTILECLYKRRCFQPFGIVKMVNENVDDLDSMEYDFLDDCENSVEWHWVECDWVDAKKTMTGYIPPEIEFQFYE